MELNFERQRFVLIPPAPAAVQQPRAVAVEQAQHLIFVLRRQFGRRCSRMSHERDSYRLFSRSHALEHHLSLHPQFAQNSREGGFAPSLVACRMRGVFEGRPHVQDD
jgi:hypothetical protein